jgi:L-gulonolactone oxidase
MTLQALHENLAPQGFAMPNVGSISDTSIAGVISTGTHGSGMKYGCLSTHVLALEVVLADGSRVRCSRSERPDLFLSTLCGLGTTGLIIRVTLEIERAFQLKEVREVMHIDDVIRNIESISLSGEYVRAWWSPQTNSVSVMSSNRTIEVRLIPTNRLNITGT